MTRSQQALLFEAGLSCGVQGSPASASPHLGRTHLALTRGSEVSVTQLMSHSMVQHAESISHTAAQQFPSRQPGRSCCT